MRRQCLKHLILVRMKTPHPSAKTLLADNLRAWKSAFRTLDRVKRGLILFWALFCGTGRQSAFYLFTIRGTVLKISQRGKSGGA